MASVGRVLVFLAAAVFTATASGQQNELYVEDGAAFPGAMVDVQVRGSNEDSVQGFVIVATYPTSDLEFYDAVVGSDVANLVDVELVQVLVDAGQTPTAGAVSLATVFDAFPPFEQQVLPVGSDREFMRVTFTVTGAPGNCAEIVLDEPLSPYANTIFVIFGLSTAPALSPGEICILDPEFLRGDVNGDGVVTLPDAVEMLRTLFVGPTVPSCEDAFDANDDGEVSVSDPITILGALFGPAPIFLPPPALTCGTDPTADGLVCLVPGVCP